MRERRSYAASQGDATNAGWSWRLGRGPRNSDNLGRLSSTARPARAHRGRLAAAGAASPDAERPAELRQGGRNRPVPERRAPLESWPTRGCADAGPAACQGCSLRQGCRGPVSGNLDLDGAAKPTEPEKLSLLHYALRSRIISDPLGRSGMAMDDGPQFSGKTMAEIAGTAVPRAKSTVS